MHEFQNRFKEFVGIVNLYEKEMKKNKNPFKNNEFFTDHKKRKLAQIIIPFIKTLVDKTESTLTLKEQFQISIRKKDFSLITEYSTKYGAPSLLDDASNVEDIYKITVAGITLKKNTANILINYILCALCDNRYNPNVSEVAYEDLNDVTKLYMSERAEHQIYLMCEGIKTIDIDLLLHLTDKALSFALEQTLKSLPFSICITPREMINSKEYIEILKSVKIFKLEVTKLKDYYDNLYQKTTMIVKMLSNLDYFISKLTVDNATKEQLAIMNATFVRAIIHLAKFDDITKKYVSENNEDISIIKNEYTLYEKYQKLYYYQIASNETKKTVSEVYQDKETINNLKKNFNQMLKTFKKNEVITDEFITDSDDIKQSLIKKDFDYYLAKYVDAINEKSRDDVYETKYKKLYEQDLEKLKKKLEYHILLISEMNAFITDYLDNAIHVALIVLYQAIEAFYNLRVSKEYLSLSDSLDDAQENFNLLTERLIKHLEEGTYYRKVIDESKKGIDYDAFTEVVVEEDCITYCKKIMDLCL